MGGGGGAGGSAFGTDVAARRPLQISIKPRHGAIFDLG